MAIAVVTTLVTHVPTKLVESLCQFAPPFPADMRCPTYTQIDSLGLVQVFAAIGIGAIIGITTARRIKMTDMPQLVAAFHSLVGMAAVLVAAAAFLNPLAFGIADADGAIHVQSRIEMGLGIAIGAITFSGSVIAFLKLAGKMSGAPIILPLRHVINLGTLAAILGLIGYFCVDQSPWVFWTITALAFVIGFLLIVPIGGGGHAGRGVDAEQLFGLGGGGNGVHAAQQRDDHHRCAGRLVGRDPQLHHVQGHEPQLHQCHCGRFRRGGVGRRRGEGNSARGSAARPKTRPI